MDDEFFEYVEGYFDGCRSTRFDIKGDRYYLHHQRSSGFHFSFIALDLLLEKKEGEKFDGVKIIFFIRMLRLMKPGRDVSESGTIRLQFKDFKGYIGKTSFYATKKYFLKEGVLIRTPVKRRYILNPEYSDMIKYNSRPLTKLELELKKKNKQ